MQTFFPQSLRFTLRGFLRGLLLPVFAVYLVFLVALYFAQRPLVLHAPIFQSGVFPFVLPSTLKRSNWTPGGQYSGIVIEPRDLPPKATVIFFHGNNGTAESVGARGIGSAIAQNGYRVVMVEYPGFGRRPGEVSFDGVLEGSQSAFQVARQEFKGPLILAGESYGAAMAAQVARRQGDAAEAVMLFVPWDSLLSVTEETLPYVPVKYMLRREYNSIEALAHFSKPVLVAAAQYDELIPPHHGQALAKAVPTARFVMLKGVRHNWWYQAVDKLRWAQFMRFASGGADTVQ